MPYPYTPPPIDPEEIEPVALPKSISNNISFPITYNPTTDHFEVGVAAFRNSEEGLRKLAQYLIHFTIRAPARRQENPNDPLPKERPAHLISKVAPRFPKAISKLADKAAMDKILENLQAELAKKKPND